MRFTRMVAGILAAMFCCAAGAAGAPSPWDGTWVLDPGLSVMNPGDLVIERRGTGYRWPGRFDHDAVCDGRPRRQPDGFALACTQAGRSTRITLLEHGRTFKRLRYDVAPDGRGLAVTYEFEHGALPRTRTTDRYVRTSSEHSGLAGHWRGVSTMTSRPDMMILRVHGNALYYLDTLDGDVTEAPLDGRPTRFWDSGPDGWRWTNRLIGARRIYGEELFGGRPNNREFLELSPDGRRIRLWVPGGERTASVYVKQESMPLAPLGRPTVPSRSPVASKGGRPSAASNGRWPTASSPGDTPRRQR